MTIPPERSAGQRGHIADHNDITETLTSHDSTLTNHTTSLTSLDTRLGTAEGGLSTLSTTVATKLP